MRHSIIYVFKDKDEQFHYGESKIFYRSNLEIVKNILYQHLYNTPELRNTGAYLLNRIRQNRYQKYVFESLNLFKDFDKLKWMSFQTFYIIRNPAPIVPPDELILLDEEAWKLENEL